MESVIKYNGELVKDPVRRQQEEKESGYKEDLSSKKFAEDYAELGAMYLHIKEYGKAAEAYSNSMKYMPAAARGYIGLGLAQLSLKQYDKAIADFTSAIARDPKSADAFFQRAEAYSAQGKYVHATINYKMAHNIYLEKDKFMKAEDALQKSKDCGSKPNSR